MPIGTRAAALATLAPLLPVPASVPPLLSLLPPPSRGEKREGREERGKKREREEGKEERGAGTQRCVASGAQHDAVESGGETGRRQARQSGSVREMGLFKAMHIERGGL